MQRQLALVTSSFLLLGACREEAVCPDPVGAPVTSGTGSAADAGSASDGGRLDPIVANIVLPPAADAGTSEPGATSGAPSADIGDPCTNCTRTQGYWKNHAEAWPVDALRIGGVLYTRATLIDFLRTPTEGDASIILGHQLVAARLNLLHGAFSGAVTTTMIQAEQWIVDHGDADGLPLGVFAGSGYAEGVALGEALDAYNNGKVGPGHCP